MRSPSRQATNVERASSSAETSESSHGPRPRKRSGVRRRPHPRSTDSHLSSQHEQIAQADEETCIACVKPSGLKHCRVAARGDRRDYQVSWLRKTNVSPNFNKDGPENRLTLCMTHRQEFKRQMWTMVPSEDDIQSLIAFERDDFERRQLLWEKSKEGDPPSRVVPAVTLLSGWFEIVPIVIDGFLRAGPYEIRVIPYKGMPGTITTYFQDSIKHRFDWRKCSITGAVEVCLPPPAINPWALLLHCIEVIGDGYFPQSSRLYVIQRNLIILRDLYNRRLPIR